MTNNLRDEIAARMKVCIPGNQRQDELLALADAVAALERMRDPGYFSRREVADAALAQIAGRLGGGA